MEGYNVEIHRFKLGYEMAKWHVHNFPEIMEALALAAGLPMIQIPTEPSERFPLGVELTSLENGKLVIAPEGTPREEIVGVVTLNGLETK